MLWYRRLSRPLALATLLMAVPAGAAPELKLSEAPGESGPQRASPARSLWERLRECTDGTDRDRGWLRHLAQRSPAAPRFRQACDVDWHKPVFILPYTYSRDYESSQTEVLFAVSARFRPLGIPLYLAYSQRSFWSLYDAERSRPFRETVFNPEIYYRWMPRRGNESFVWGFDGGYEHESNGRDIPESRSWDRLYIAPFIERGGTAVQLKLWYRIPEDKDKATDDPGRDDNPDIEQYYGYGELNLYRDFNRKRGLNAMARWNPGSERGALRLEYLQRFGDGDLFWTLYAFHGYGESLTDYNDSVTRVGIGFALAR